MFRLFLLTTIVLALAGTAPAADPTPAQTDTAFFALRLPGFFAVGSRARTNPDNAQMKLYLVRRNGQWVAGVGNSNNDKGKPCYNMAFFPVDLTGLTLVDNKLVGKIVVTLPADPWVPADQQAHVATIMIDGTLVAAQDPTNETASVTGVYKATIAGDAKDLAASALPAAIEGKLVGGVGGTAPNDVGDASYDLAMFNLIPGAAKESAARRRALSLGVKSGKVVSARLGLMDIKHKVSDYQTLETPEGFTVSGDCFAGTLSFTGKTLEGEDASFVVTLEGQRVVNWTVGSWKGKVTTQDGKTQDISGYFRGNVTGSAFIPAVTVVDNRPWFVEDATVTPFKPGEHPRLFFRKKDVPELKRRAETPEGQKIIKRLRFVLDGKNGDTMPTAYNPATRAYAGGFKGGPGSYTIYHGAGYGFLYQLTGEARYADLARQCVEKAFAGQRDADDRYAFVAPGGELRAGPSVGWTAVAYDLCYDAWPEDFRKQVALKIQNYADERGGEWNQPEGITLRKMALTPKMGPGSNHFGAVIGGTGLAVLAIQDDPGTDGALLTKYMESLERQVPRGLSAGWGDGGYYNEGWGPANVGHHMGFINFVQALRVARGHDYANSPHPNLANTVLVPYCLLLQGPPATFVYRAAMPGNYGTADFRGERGWYPHFCDSFGILTKDQQAAYLWSYQHIVQPDRATDDFDSPSHAPHRPMLALINWPIFSGIQARNPAEVLPKYARDTLYEHFAFRNRWQDGNDTVVTLGLNLPDGTKPREVMVWGLGQRLGFGEPPRGVKVAHFAPGKDGSAILSALGYAIAIDFSGASGAEVMLVSVGPAPRDAKDTDKAKFSTIKAQSTTYNVLTLSASDKHPEAQARGDTLVVGGQTVSFADGKLTLTKFTPATK